MRPERMLRVWLWAAVFALGWSAIAQADCRWRVHQPVVLFSTTDDPDVFVWDSRFRLQAYQSGSYDVDKALAPHAFLVSSGTRARLIACVSAFVHPKYREGTDDAVGILIVSGPNRGRTGWIMGQDARRLR